MKETEHPGKTVLAYLEMANWPQAELVRRTGLSHVTISKVCQGQRSISPRLAIGLEKAFEKLNVKKSAEFWLELQSTYKLYVAQQKKRAPRRAK